jgi:16S rRNA (guanine966-N2)-methyltransferase
VFFDSFGQNTERMRITGGSLCGRQVEVPKGEIRPAMDRMRESVFAVLGDLTGKSFLDLFSGSGIIALEAASRGASPVASVERDPIKRKVILKNLAIAPERIECHIMAVELFLKRTKEVFDIVFCDPPFPYRFKVDLIGRIGTSDTLKPGGLLLLHYPHEDPIPDALGPLALEDERVYGRSVVRFYRKAID